MSRPLTQAFKNFDALPDSAAVHVDTVAHLHGCSTVTVWRRAKAGRGFPKPYKLGPQSTVWNVGELRRHLATVRGQSAEATS